ncbi:hypothetical protein K435DRAFT_811701 [Dendrothele bispora CBS 962.96]|uniref:Uncharacterized protein n=1 Tax=Dendrothele bispora (strain CBS 962.96) TaxID=1314807 RepID=A0A4S8KRH8_DENBC|nr:hypothetical protein K435DRAFT_811701 [Dendrothele bispora CBS 962.96]
MGTCRYLRSGSGKSGSGFPRVTDPGHLRVNSCGTLEPVQKQPTKPAKTATKPATASKAPAKISGGASKSSTPAPARPYVYYSISWGHKGNQRLYYHFNYPSNPRKRNQDAISSAQESTPASNLCATKERAARSRTLPAIAVLEGSPEPPPAKKQRISKPAQTTNAQASSSTAAVKNSLAEVKGASQATTQEQKMRQSQ